MIALQTIFWVSAGAMFYSYVLYPIITIILSAGKKFSTAPSTAVELPRVFILFAAYNEEAVIGKKLQTIADSDYPADKVHVWVGSDASTDNTDRIIREFTARLSNLRLFRFDDRTGKAGILNALNSQYQAMGMQGDLLILTDANVMFSIDTIRQLATSFSDPKVGLVGATILNTEVHGGISGSEKAYITRENHIKYREGLIWGAVMGAFGAGYAIRAELFPTIPSNFLMEDFYVTMHVLRMRLKAVMNPKAICYEDVPASIGEEFKRKKRISAGNFQNLSRYWKMLWPPWSGVAFAFLSHKVLRWIGPLFLFAAFVSSAILASQGFLYLVFFLIQAVLLLVALVDIGLQKARIPTGPMRFISYFCAMNAALLAGFILYWRGVSSSVWKPTERALS